MTAGAALGIYEELQLWDALVVCYRLLDKRSAAEDLLKRRLKVGVMTFCCTRAFQQATRISASIGSNAFI